MPIAIYIDENVHRAIADELRIRGLDALSVREDGRGGDFRSRSVGKSNGTQAHNIYPRLRLSHRRWNSPDSMLTPFPVKD